jgi:membrane protease YdiL (CAAX protease family)
MAGLLTSDLGTLGILWLVGRRRFKPLFAHYFAPVSKRAFFGAAFTGLAIAVVLNGIDLWLSWSGLVKFTNSDFELAMVPHSVGQFFVAVLVIVLFVPFFEEMFFRGFLLDWLRRVGGVWVGVLLSAALFSAAHVEILFHPGAQGWLYTANIFLVGVVMAVWVLRTGSLRTSFALHATYNFVGILGSIFLR